MTGRELAALIGSTGSYQPTRGLSFAVRVLDARTRFGNVDVLVQPVAGSGEQWITLDRFSPDN